MICDDLRVSQLTTMILSSQKKQINQNKQQTTTANNKQQTTNSKQHQQTANNTDKQNRITSNTDKQLRQTEKQQHYTTTLFNSNYQQKTQTCQL